MLMKLHYSCNAQLAMPVTTLMLAPLQTHMALTGV
jgi:hypothetical protein